MFGWRIARVEGDSMSPTLSDGDYVFARRKVATLGDVVLIRHMSLGLIVKRICKIDETHHYTVAGDNPRSTSSDAMGLIPREAITGVVYWRVSPDGIHKVRRESVSSGLRSKAG